MTTYNEAYMIPNPMMPGQRVSFNAEVCNGCNVCIGSCPG